jgi:hypothetical protein
MLGVSLKTLYNRLREYGPSAEGAAAQAAASAITPGA